MPSKSKSQQRFMGMVHALQKGELSPSDVSDKVKDAADQMDDKDAEDYASTKHKGKPEHVPKEVIRKVRETIRQMVKENPAAAAAAFQAMQQAKVNNPQTGRTNKVTTAYHDKSHPQHKTAVSIFKKLKDKFKKSKEKPTKGTVHNFLNKEDTKRDYKAEYKKFQSSDKAKKYRAELNKYNRKKGTYGNGDGKDASHKGGKIVGFEAQSKNRGRAEKSRLPKEGFGSTDTISLKKIKEFEQWRKDNAEQLGYTLSGVSDIKNESTKEYGKSLEKIAKNRQLRSLSKKDRDTLIKISKLMKRANESVKEGKALKFTNIKDRTLERHLKKVTKKVGAELEKISNGFKVKGDMRALTAVVDYVFDKSIKKGVMKGGGMSQINLVSEAGMGVLTSDQSDILQGIVLKYKNKNTRAILNIALKSGYFKKVDKKELLGYIDGARQFVRYMKSHPSVESVNETLGKRCTVKEVAKWLKTLEEFRYRKVRGVDARRVASFVNNGMNEEELPISLQKKWEHKKYGREKHLAGKFIETFLKQESVNEIFPKGAGKKISKAMQKGIEPQGNIKKVLDVAKNKQSKKIGGTLVDLTTANLMTQVWDKVNDRSKEKMNKMNSKQLINLILKLWNRVGTPRV